MISTQKSQNGGGGGGRFISITFERLREKYDNMFVAYCILLDWTAMMSAFCLKHT